MWTISLLLFAVLSIASFPAWAGGTIYYHPLNGTPLQWEVNEDGKAEIHYIVDAGGLGRLTHEQAVTLLQAAMDIWEEVANIEFIMDGITDIDIDETNYEDYTVSELFCEDSSGDSFYENDIQKNRISLIVFDNSESSVIINDVDGIAGTGNSYGITAVTCIKGSSADPESIASAQIIFNGTTIDGTDSNFDDLTVNAFLGIMVHELGHFLGLDHSDVNGALLNLFNAGEIGEEYLEFLPTMARLDPNDGYGEFMATPHPDDIAAVQALYPLEDSPRSVLTGTVTDANGIDFRGAQIQLHNTNDPLCKVYSFISGKQCTPLALIEGAGVGTIVGDTCGLRDVPSTNTGDLFLRAIPPGSYRLAVQEVIDEYKGGVIHPWATNNPLPELFGEAEFYNSNDIASEDPLSMSEITVIDGINLDGLNMMLSSNTADSDDVENLLDLSLFSQSPFTDSLTVTATSRCQPNTVDYAALIGVEEIVGNNGEDDTESDAESSPGGCGLIGMW